jgi:hypothetical protein
LNFSNAIKEQQADIIFLGKIIHASDAFICPDSGISASLQHLIAAFILKSYPTPRRINPLSSFSKIKNN